MLKVIVEVGISNTNYGFIGLQKRPVSMFGNLKPMQNAIFLPLVEMTVHNLKDLPEAARKLLAAYPHSRVFAFFGEMGAGKTTFIKEICTCLGVLDAGTSPTFSIVNEYLTEQGETVYHFDCYRFEREEEALDMGMEEYLDSGCYCFIEWPQKIENLLPSNYVRVEVIETNQTRLIKVST